MRPSVCSSTSARTASSDRLRSRAIRATCCSAYSGLMCGSRPEPLASSASGATSSGVGAVEPGRRLPPILDRCDEVLVLGTEVGSGGGERVVPVTGRGRPALEVLRLPLEGLADQLRADHRAALPRPGSRPRCRRRRPGRSRSRTSGYASPTTTVITISIRRAAHSWRAAGWASGVDMRFAFQPRPGIWDTSRSMSLMPMNGATMPPRP